jgi:hypothetical protein
MGHTTQGATAGFAEVVATRAAVEGVTEAAVLQAVAPEAAILQAVAPEAAILQAVAPEAEALPAGILPEDVAVRR